MVKYKWSNINAYLVKKLGIHIPTSTMVRKIGSTCAARSLDPTSNGLVTSQMSHQSAVSIKHYRCISGTKDAAVAFNIMEELRAKKLETVEGVESGESAESVESAVKKYCVWSMDHTAKLGRLFAKTIARGQTCSLSEAKDVLARRSAKQIQDKVQTIMIVINIIYVSLVCISSLARTIERCVNKNDS
jgi:hypothetical protein